MSWHVPGGLSSKVVEHWGPDVFQTSSIPMTDFSLDGPKAVSVVHYETVRVPHLMSVSFYENDSWGFEVYVLFRYLNQSNKFIFKISSSFIDSYNNDHELIHVIKSRILQEIFKMVETNYPDDPLSSAAKEAIAKRMQSITLGFGGWESSHYQYIPDATGGLLPGGLVQKSTAANISEKSNKLPAMDMVVETPCEHGGTERLWLLVQHLNDKHRWTREAIADWIDKLHEEGIINAEFGGEQPENSLERTGIESNGNMQVIKGTSATLTPLTPEQIKLLKEKYEKHFNGILGNENKD